ncbi:hypothetical protein HBH1_01734 [Herbaspirillum sp. BH-1]|uniref:Uncharacterized protein n=1 Tax=Herbaspirillum frisingense TaxID=92645 RepID=A0ABU1P9V6_9BURK|nr:MULTISPECIES: hypothetical protein [Herbaspirillum]MDR6582490.1 hypothetical protein [Herbaspirillum frisingense]PLY59807.1 hypothetical protein HBH1_01734 [Herbaspirillum sp. BH-1]
MSQAIPLPEDTTRASEGAMDKSKPHALPQQPQHRQAGQDQGQDEAPAGKRPASTDGEEHPLSVGQP